MNQKINPRFGPSTPYGRIRPCPIITDPQGCYAGKPIEKSQTAAEDLDEL